MNDPTIKQEKSDATANPSDGQNAAKQRRKVLKKNRSDQRNDAQKDVVARMQSLRSAAKQASRAYLSNLERGILEVIDVVNGAGDDGEKGVKTGTLEKLIDILEDISLKPEKGRRKDLKRIELAIEEMLRVVSKTKA
jgi:hypothetical protein